MYFKDFQIFAKACELQKVRGKNDSCLYAVI